MEIFIIGLGKITGYLKRLYIRLMIVFFSIPAYAVVGLAVGNGDYHSNFVEVVQEKGGDKNGTQFTFLIGKLSRGYCTDIRK